MFGASTQQAAKWIRDLVNLSELTEQSIIDTLYTGFVDDQIYTCVGPVLVSLNPMKPLEIYGNEVIARYKANARNLTKELPHVYAIAQQAFTQMIQIGQSQSVLVRYRGLKIW